MKTKSIIIASGLILGGFALAAYQKFKTLKAVFDRMSIYPSGLRNVRAGLHYFTFKLDITIKNPTNESFSVTGASIARFKRILAYRNGHFLGMATLNLEEIEIPATGSIEIKDIPFEVSPENVMLNILTIEGFSMEQLTFVGVVEVLGKEYIIES